MRLAAGREQWLLQSPSPFQRKRLPSTDPAIPPPPALMVWTQGDYPSAPMMGTLQDSHCPFTKISVIKVIPKTYTAFLDLRSAHQTLWLRVVYMRVWRARMAVLCYVKEGGSSETQGLLGQE